MSNASRYFKSYGKNLPDKENAPTSGWMNIKRKGRDDSRIEKDAKQAKIKRTGKLPATKSRKEVSAKKSVQKKKTQLSMSSDSEDEMSENSFIVRSDEEDDVQSYVSEGSFKNDDDDFSTDEDTMRKKIRPKKENFGKKNDMKRSKKALTIEIEDSDEEMLSKNERKAMKMAIQRSLEDTPQATCMKVSIDSTSSEEVSKMKISEMKKELGSYSISTKTMCEKEELVEALCKARANHKKEIISRSTSTIASSNSKPISLLNESSDDDDDDDIIVSRKNKVKMSKTKQKKSSSMFNKAKKGKQGAESNRRVIRIESSDEEGDKSIVAGQADDEIELYESSEDEGSKEAESVLDTTTRLSKFICTQMHYWCNSQAPETQNNISNSNINNGVSGMLIVDGSLALSTISDDCVQNAWTQYQKDKKADSSDKNLEFSRAQPRWIPRDEIENYCSGLKLSDYQLIGVNWIALLHSLTYNKAGNDKLRTDKHQGSSVNGILADEMGLGKTVQTIAFLNWLKCTKSGHKVVKPTTEDGKECFDVTDSSDEDEATDDKNISRANEVHRPHLVVVPASVLGNWEREFQKFAPNLKIVKYHGSLRERDELREYLREELRTIHSSKLPLDVILTPFSYFTSEKPDDRIFLRKFDFDYMVVDEAHCLKNPKSNRYQNMAKFKTRHRLLLTGTPVQNSPKELMSLLCYLMPLFKPKDKEEGHDGGESMLSHFVSLTTANMNDESAYTKLKSLLAPFILRRRKKDVLSQMLPPKERRIEIVPNDGSAKKLYDAIIEAHVNRKKGISVVDVDNQTSMNEANHLFTEMRKAANHPLLLRQRFQDPAVVDHLAQQLYLYGYFGRDSSCDINLVKKELQDFSDFDIHMAALDIVAEKPYSKREMERYILDESAIYTSPKFKRLQKLLPELVKERHRILIFSQWTRCLDLIGCLLENMHMKFLRLDGQTNVSERQNLIDEFNTDKSINVFILSTRAGGLGINLTSADVCILHDLDFNPFNDSQAEDRCHRIGQTKPVTIIKMVTQGTVDEDIFTMQERKEKMNEAIFSSTKNPSKSEEAEAKSKILQNAISRHLVISPQVLKPRSGCKNVAKSLGKNKLLVLETSDDEKEGEKNEEDNSSVVYVD